MLFSEFWEVWPHRRSKHQAEKAFTKLSADNKRKAIERAKQWCQDWRKENPTASHILPATYLNQKRFLDMDEASADNAKTAEGLIEMQASWIRDGKTFLCQNIKASRVQEILAAGLVTTDQCRKAGVL